MTRQVTYTLQADQQLFDLFEWIVATSGYEDQAEHYVSAILDFCDDLASFPFIGVARNDLMPGLRVVGFRRRVTVAYVVTEEIVEILGIYYGGRDYESLLSTYNS